ncbi:MAG: lipase family protein, partial [Gemmatimonadales bacterium]
LVWFTVAVDRGQPRQPDDFYDAPELSGRAEPGSILRTEPLDGAPEGSRAWRILYVSKDIDDVPVAVSGILVVPDGEAPEGGRPVVASPHGAIGIGRNCAPSLRSNWTVLIPGLELLVERGYVVVATDYEGLGAPGRHPFLVGRVAAMNVLDSVRAARNFEEADASSRFVSWGQSQGGHTSLFVGETAATYAPELTLVGIAATVPPTDLVTLFDRNLGSTFGNVLASFAFEMWPKLYEEAEIGQVVARSAQPVVRNISTYCFLEEKQALSILPGALLLNVRYLSNDPSETEPWSRLLRENSPGSAPIPVPIFIGQGGADPLVVPEVTVAYARRVCGEGATLVYREYAGVGHNPAGEAAAPDAVAWMADRFEGRPAPRECP